MKIFVFGPRGAGKTTFVYKMFGKDYELIKEYIFEKERPSEEELEDSHQSFLILPDNKTLKERGAKELTSEERNDWMEFYFNNDRNIVFIEDF